MKVLLDPVFSIWSKVRNLVGNLLFESDDVEFLMKTFSNFQESKERSQSTISIQIIKKKIKVTYIEKGISQLIFTQDIKNISASDTSKRMETLQFQKQSIELDSERRKFLNYLERNDCDWIFYLLYPPNSFSNTDFARLFGYNSFFHRWFSFFRKQLSIEHIPVWKEYFYEVYHDTHLKEELYWSHFYIYLISNEIIQILDTNPKFQRRSIRKFFSSQLDLMNKFFQCPNFTKFQLFRKFLHNALHSMVEFHTPKKIHDFLGLFYQELITFTRRHTLGEFYTHTELSKKMVQTEYSDDIDVLDPCCGSGTFLLEVINYCVQQKRLSSISKLHGIDIHPLSVLIVKINISLAFFIISNSGQTDEYFQTFTSILSNITHGDFLFRNSKEKYDLIIGNPPWIVINGINSERYKEKLKSLSRKLKISTDSQNTSNLEISSLFLKKISTEHMKKGSKLFLILSAGILNGSQNEGVRRFSGLKRIKLWLFDKDLFNVHNICILAEFGKEDIQTKFHIQTYLNHVSSLSKFTIKSTKTYIPTYIRVGDKFLPLDQIKNLPEYNEWGVGRLIPKQNITMSVKKSTYHDKFRQGACLGPRNLLFITPFQALDADTRIIKIYPDRLVQYKKYGIWDFIAYPNAVVEEKYIHDVAKSTELIPFFLLRYNTAFLPLARNFMNSFVLEGRKNSLTKNEINLLFDRNPHAKKHYQLLDRIYSEKIKSGGAIKDLFLNINYNNKLLHENQTKIHKVVYNGIGSHVKAAYLTNNALIDSSLYYYIPSSEMEAYYLVGILNSSIITEFVSKMGSTGAGGSLRNIHKNPLKCNIFEYKEIPSQKLVAKLGRSLEKYVQNFAINFVYQEFVKAVSRMFCESCGGFINRKSYPRHKNTCKVRKELHYIMELIHSLSEEEKNILLDKKIFRDLLLRNPVAIQKSLKNKMTILLGYVIKPKTLQNRLRKDEMYNKKMNVLNIAVKSLWK